MLPHRLTVRVHASLSEKEASNLAIFLGVTDARELKPWAKRMRPA
jgi:hypothetical protein